MTDPNEPRDRADKAVSGDLAEIKLRLMRVETRLVKLINALGFGDQLHVSEPDRDRR